MPIIPTFCRCIVLQRGWGLESISAEARRRAAEGRFCRPVDAEKSAEGVLLYENG